MKLAKFKRTVARYHPRSSHASVSVRYREQVYAMLRARGVNAAWYCMDDMAKVPLLINARSCARMRWMFAAGPVRTLDHDFVVGKRLLVAVSGIVTLDIDCAGECAGYEGECAVLEELIQRNRNYPKAVETSVRLRPYRYDPVNAASHLQDIWAKLGAEGSVGATPAISPSMDNGPDYAADAAAALHLYGRLWRKSGAIMLSVVAHAPYWSRKHFQIEQQWGPFRRMLEGLNLGYREGETFDPHGKVERDYIEICENGLDDCVRVAGELKTGGRPWSVEKVCAGAASAPAGFSKDDLMELRKFNNGTQKAMKGSPGLLEEMGDLIDHCTRRPQDVIFIA